MTGSPEGQRDRALYTTENRRSRYEEALQAELRKANARYARLVEALREGVTRERYDARRS